jgi:hypothetical protein
MLTVGPDSNIPIPFHQQLPGVITS